MYACAVQVIATPTPSGHHSFLGFLFRLCKCVRQFPMMEKIKYYTIIIDVSTYTDNHFGIILNEIHRTLRNKLKYITLAVDANSDDSYVDT